MPHRRLIGAVVILCCLVAAAPAAPAAADSIAYIQGGDVRLATPDGARKQQVTRTRAYSDVSQADDGSFSRKRRTLASAGKTVKRVGTVTFKLKARGKATITATFKPTSGARQKASKALTLLG